MPLPPLVSQKKPAGENASPTAKKFQIDSLRGNVKGRGRGGSRGRGRGQGKKSTLGRKTKPAQKMQLVR